MTALTDAAGATHAPAGPNPRIACFVPSITELVIDLGLAEQLVARTQYCIHPESVVKDIPAIGGTKKVSLPKLEALGPTHVILNVDENTREMDAALREAGYEVIVTHPLEPEDNPALFRLIGSIFDKRREADILCAQFAERLASVRTALDGAPSKRVCYFCWQDPWMTVSADTYISRTLKLANWTTVGHDPTTRYPTIAIDNQLIAETDLFLFSTEPFAFTQDHARAFADEHGLPRERCLVIDGEYTSWYGSRAIPALDYLRGFALAVADRSSPSR